MVANITEVKRLWFAIHGVTGLMVFPFNLIFFLALVYHKVLRAHNHYIVLAILVFSNSLLSLDLVVASINRLSLDLVVASINRFNLFQNDQENILVFRSVLVFIINKYQNLL